MAGDEGPCVDGELLERAVPPVDSHLLEISAKVHRRHLEARRQCPVSVVVAATRPQDSRERVPDVLGVRHAFD